MSSKPNILYRISRDGIHLFLRVPDDDTEKDGVLTFNRLMADLGFPDPKAIFNERLGVAVVPTTITIRKNSSLIRLNVLNEIEAIFSARRIQDTAWYSKRF